MLIFILALSFLFASIAQQPSVEPLVIVASFEDGSPAEGLGLLAVDFTAGTPIAGGRTDASGQARLDLPAGRYRLQLNTDLELMTEPPLLPKHTLAERDGIGIEVGPLHTLQLLVQPDGTVMVDPASASGRDAAGATAVALATAGLPVPTAHRAEATPMPTPAMIPSVIGQEKVAPASASTPTMVGVTLALGFVIAAVIALFRALGRAA